MAVRKRRPPSPARLLLQLVVPLLLELVETTLTTPDSWNSPAATVASYHETYNVTNYTQFYTTPNERELFSGWSAATGFKRERNDPAKADYVDADNQVPEDTDYHTDDYTDDAEIAEDGDEEEKESEEESTTVDGADANGDVFLNDGATARVKRNAVRRNSGLLWNSYKQGGKYIIPYTIKTKYNVRQLNSIYRSMIAIEEATCIQFQRITAKNQHKYKDHDYAVIKSVTGGGCHSTIGRKQGKTLVRLEIRVTVTRTCMIKHLVLHELLHLLGLYHEHQRRDRKRFVRVRLRLVKKERRFNYKVVHNAELFRLPYDFESLTHYKNNTFALDPLNWVMIARDKYKAKQELMGTSRDASVLDLLKVNLLYKCPGYKALLSSYRRGELTRKSIRRFTPRTRIAIPNEKGKIVFVPKNGTAPKKSDNNGRMKKKMKTKKRKEEAKVALNAKGKKRRGRVKKGDSATPPGSITKHLHHRKKRNGKGEQRAAGSSEIALSNGLPLENIVNFVKNQMGI